MHRRQPSPHHDLAEPACHLRGADEGRHEHRLVAAESQPLEQRHGMRRDRREHEAVQGQRRCEQGDRHQPAASCQMLYWCIGHARCCLVAACPMQHQPVDRQAHEQVQASIDQQRVGPANAKGEIMAHRPEYSGGKAAEQREIGDGAARALPHDLRQAGEGRVVGGEAHGEAEQQPADHVGGGMRESSHERQTRRSEDRACDHHAPPADPVHQPATMTRDHAAQQQGGGEGAEDQRAGPPG